MADEPETKMESQDVGTPPTENAEAVQTNNQPKSANKIKGILSLLFGKDVHWLVKTVVTIIVGGLVTGLLAAIGYVWETRCDSLPLNSEQIRDQLCQPPRYLDSDFVIVSSDLLTLPDTDNILSQSLSHDLETSLISLERPDRPPMFVIESNDMWVDRVTEGTDFSTYPIRQAERLNADVVIYGQINRQQPPVFKPAFYVHRDGENYADPRSLVPEIDLTNLNIQIPIIGQESQVVSEWVNNISLFLVGIEYLEAAKLYSDSQDVDARLLYLQRALDKFEAVTSVNDDFYSVASIYAGNAVLEIALIEQQQYEASSLGCVNGRCTSYDDALVQRYLQAWEHYTDAIIHAGTTQDELAIRGLIGRGNVQYRLARLSRTLESDDSRFMNFNCNVNQDQFAMEGVDSYESLAVINWVQRALSAKECYAQANVRTNSDTLVHAKALFGAAQTTQWLGMELKDDGYLAMGFEDYSAVIDFYQSAPLPIDQNDLTTDQIALRCLVGFAYGERAQIRWSSTDSAINNTVALHNDLKSAIEILQNQTMACNATTTIEKYKVDQEIIP